MADETWMRWSAEERERHVSPSSVIGGNYRPYIERYRRESDEAVLHSPLAQLDQAVPSSKATVDVFPSAHQSSDVVLAFIHGGYWQELDRAHSRFAAPALNASGWTYAAIGYPLAPKARIAEMIHVCAEALIWLR